MYILTSPRLASRSSDHRHLFNVPVCVRCVYVGVYTCMCVGACIRVYACMCMCLCVCVLVCMGVHVGACVEQIQLFVLMWHNS